MTLTNQNVTETRPNRDTVQVSFS